MVPSQVAVSQVGVAPFFYKVALVQLVLGIFAFFLGFSQIYFPGAMVSSIFAIAAACITLKWCVCCSIDTEMAHVSCSRTVNAVTVVSSVCGFISALIFFIVWMYVATWNERGENQAQGWTALPEPLHRASLCRELQHQQNYSKSGRARMVLLLTDGYPTHGEYQVPFSLPPHIASHTSRAHYLCRYPATPPCTLVADSECAGWGAGVLQDPLQIAGESHKITATARFPVSVHALAFGKGADLDMLRLVSTATGLAHPALRPRQHTRSLQGADTGHGPGVGGRRQAGWRSGFSTTLL